MGQVSYELTVRLEEDAPIGYLNDTLTLVTNDPNPRAARVPIEVEGVVTSPVTVRPSPLMLGVLKPGQCVTRQLVIHGKTPFSVVRVAATDPRVKASCDAQKKTVHVIPVQFTADEGTGRIASKLEIVTDLDQSNAVQVDLQAMIVDDDPS
jgi:hypothetical protein